MTQTVLIDIEIEDDRWIETLSEIHSVVSKAARTALIEVGVASESDVVILLTDDEHMRELNSDFRRKATPTNILAFPAPKDLRLNGVLTHLGDLALGYETCRKEAIEQGKSFEHHVSHLAVHGTLHLLGFDHEKDQDAEIMEALERKILKTLGIDDPYQDIH